MKSLTPIALFLLLSVPVFAKMASTVKIQNIQHIAIEEQKIIIIGDGVLTSRMVTTEELKDSGFVIMGQPSAEYTAQGYSVVFTITPYSLVINDPTGETPDDSSIQAMRSRFKEYWVQSVKAAQALQVGGQVELTIQGSDVRFRNGQLKSVTGQGTIIPPKR